MNFTPLLLLLSITVLMAQGADSIELSSSSEEVEVKDHSDAISNTTGATTTKAMKCYDSIVTYMKIRCGGECTVKGWQDTAVKACAHQLTIDEIIEGCCEI
ncbi:hypothetical protein CAEBREN_04046 [Caenorhabditis brenneri]|uniref:Uncharacterized protein n=1 Tax=Caenorhabditis brenneri TaxID=135651 RepID=G0MJC0_CAEBE|nr:hypothetical protein CAEBREN_04046 [Caenorhabditis brenneri]